MPTDKTEWGLSIEKVWVPFFKRTNKDGHTTIPEEDLTNPFNSNFSVKQSLRDAIILCKGNIIAALTAYAEGKSELPAKLTSK